MKKTKIICTIGPASDSVESLKELMLCGMNVCRLNFSHGSKEEHQVRIDNINEKKRNEIILEMAERGVATNVHYKPLPLLTAYKNLGFDISNYPNSYKQYENEITLPLYSRLTDEEVEYIISNFIDVLKQFKQC